MDPASSFLKHNQIVVHLGSEKMDGAELPLWQGAHVRSIADKRFDNHSSWSWFLHWFLSVRNLSSNYTMYIHQYFHSSSAHRQSSTCNPTGIQEKNCTTLTELFSTPCEKDEDFYLKIWNDALDIAKRSRVHRKFFVYILPEVQQSIY